MTDLTDGAMPKGLATFTKWATLGMDLAFSVAGVLAVAFPTRSIQVAVPPWGAWVWGLFFFIGGVICTVSVITDRWPLKLVGLPLLASALTLYGAVLLVQFPKLHDGAFLFVAALMFACAFGMLDRCLVVLRALRIAERGPGER